MTKDQAKMKRELIQQVNAHIKIKKEYLASYKWLGLSASKQNHMRGIIEGLKLAKQIIGMYDLK